MTPKSTFWLFAFIGMLSIVSCNSEDDTSPLKLHTKHNTEAALRKYTYSIYLENSGSLNGYLNASGDSSFKDNVNNLITEINGFQERQALNLYDVNTKVIPVAIDANETEIGNYIGHLDAPTFKARSKAKGGDQTQSNLSDIIRNIIDSTQRNEVSFLISDCIFSPGRKESALGFLSQQKSKIQLYINDKLKPHPLSTLVLQFESDFNGIYYDQNNAHKNGKFKQRPYYVICFGNEDALRNLLDNVQQQNKFKGFRNFLFLTNTKSYNVAPSIWSYTDYYEYDLDEPMVVKNIERGGRDNKFRIKLGVDFSKLPISETYINDRSNYVLSKGYTIESISPTDKNNFTHQLILVAEKPQTGMVKVSLKKQFPVWVSASNLDSDSNLSIDALTGKTFGIRYMLGGIYDAYDQYTHSPNYFTFSISVKE
jgi:hypothetical protein